MYHHMNQYKLKKISNRDKELLLLAKKIAERSVSPKRHKVGCVIVCSDGSKYLGATVARTRTIGSTCAERMALDQWYFSNSTSDPSTCYLIGTFNRKNWEKDLICTPCGVCLEMFLELIVQRGLKNLKFICGSWDLSKILLTNLKELFPQREKSECPHTNNTGIR